LFVCEDNGIGISVKTPSGWIANNFAGRKDLDYFFADGLDLAEGYAQVQRAVGHCRTTRRPTFLHLKTTRLTGHAGTDFEIEWRSFEELMALEATDPLLRSAAIALESGVYTKDSLLGLYESIRKRCFDAADEADRRPKLTSLDEVLKPLAPYTPKAVRAEAERADYADKRTAVFGGADKQPEKQPARHLACRSTRRCTTCWRSIPSRWCSARTWRRRAASIPSPRVCTRRSRARACSTRCSMKP